MNHGALVLLHHVHRHALSGVADFDLHGGGTDVLDGLLEEDIISGNLETMLLVEGGGDHLGRDGGVELARLARLALEGERLAGEVFRGLELGGTLVFFLLCTLLDLVRVAATDRGRGHECTALREQVVQGKAVTDDQEVVLLSNAFDVLEEEDFHDGEEGAGRGAVWAPEGRESVRVLCRRVNSRILAGLLLSPGVRQHPPRK